MVLAGFTGSFRAVRPTLGIQTFTAKAKALLLQLILLRGAAETAPALRPGEDKRSFSRRTKCRSGARDPLPWEHSALNKAEPAGTWRGRTFNHCTRTASETAMSGSHLSSRSIAGPPRQQLFNAPERRLLLPKGEFGHLRRWHHGSLVPPPKRTAPTCFLAAALLDELPEDGRAWRYSDEPGLIFVLSTAILCLHPEDEAALPRAGAPQAGPTATGSLPAGPVTAGPSSRCRPSTATEASSDSMNVCQEETFTTEARLEVI